VNNTLIIVRGLPGTGKTTLLESLVAPDCIFEADRYPKLYDENNERRAEFQSIAHKWCFDQLEAKMKNDFYKRRHHYERPNLAVAAIFEQRWYIDRYIDLAKHFNYNYNIINCEAAYNAQGIRYQSVHNVPHEVWKQKAASFEPWNQLNGIGINAEQILENQALFFSLIDQKKLIVFMDMDGTLKTTKSEYRYPQTPDDFKLISELISFLKRTAPEAVYIITNQRGINIGKKTEAFLEKELRAVSKALTDVLPFKTLKGIIAAPKPQSQSAFFWEVTDKMTGKLGDRVIVNAPDNRLMDKPNSGMLDWVLTDWYSKLGDRRQKLDDWRHKFPTELEDYFIVYIGDAHKASFFDDWLAFNRFKDNHEIETIYIPVEHIKHF